MNEQILLMKSDTQGVSYLKPGIFKRFLFTFFTQDDGKKEYITDAVAYMIIMNFLNFILQVSRGSNCTYK